MKKPTKPAKNASFASSRPVIGDRTLELKIEALERENEVLRAEIEQLRKSKTIIVEREVQKSPETTRREQQHNFFKYGGGYRRY